MWVMGFEHENGVEASNLGLTIRIGVQYFVSTLDCTKQIYFFTGGRKNSDHSYIVEMIRNGTLHVHRPGLHISWVDIANPGLVVFALPESLSHWEAAHLQTFLPMRGSNAWRTLGVCLQQSSISLNLSII